MASVQQHKGKYRAQVAVKGVRKSATFRTRREAHAWAAAVEADLIAQADLAPQDKHTLGDLLRKYGDEVSPSKRGARWEVIRLAAMTRAMPADLLLFEVSPEVIGKWRDARLKEVSAGSVLREIGLLSAVFEHARREWRWVSVNPVTDIRKPRSPEHRTVTISRGQIKAMCRVLGYRRGRCRSVSHAVAVAFLLALRTGMRAGEICGLTWARVHDGFCSLPVTKTVPRDVPLSGRAMRLIESMRGWDDVSVFGLRPQTLDAMFRKYRERAGLSGFTFHDSRHTAATWLAGKIDVLTLCKMFGWGNPKMAMTYYNPAARDIARRL